MEMEWTGTAVLVIDSDLDRKAEIVSILSTKGVEVLDAVSEESGLEAVFKHRPALVILDAALSDGDSLAVCRRIRQMTRSPIVILAASEQSRLIIQALDAGADDYLTSPIVAEVLLLRVWAALQRSRQDKVSDQTVYDDGYLRVDPAARQVAVIGEPVSLTATEFSLLIFLMERAGQVCTFEQLLFNVWGPDYSNRSQYIHVFIWHLRQKLEPNPKDPTYLAGVHSVGYRFQTVNGGNGNG
jgi:two-component system KDP operon response regulator KdpE